MCENKDYSELLARYDAALEGIRKSEEECGRSGVRLLVAAKYATSDELDALCLHRGLSAIGENRTDTLIEHYEGMKNKVEIHFIGHLQRNKVKGIIDKVSLIHSLESIPLAEELQRQAEKRGLTVRVLAEVNIGREESKSGVLPEELREFCLEISKYPNIKLCGFMTMAPKSTSFAEYYDYFKETYNLSIDIWKNTLHNIQEPIISMGMSDSYRAAIAAGATVVRLGSSVFGRTTEDVMKMKNNKNNI
ncbi:MAG: YggS family pyridoxal phosphate-dependent enzyme [Clostridia bacterium]|jgi:pyridoxal phosphate enzyme (YggS family)|nr:YggS family pyridoxal phosphate-dependent enzyme [Clostridia bacterium]